MTTDVLVNIDVDDLERGIDFYSRALSLQLTRRLGDNIAEMFGASAPVYLLAKPAGSSAGVSVAERRDYQRHWTPVHLDFVVEDLSAAVEKAKAAGARLESDMETHNWGRLAKMADPFGNGFCLIEFTGRGYDEIAR